MMDYTTAMSVSREELLEIQNLELQAQLLASRRETLAQKLLRKYGAPGQEDFRVSLDGKIDRPDTPVPKDPGEPAAP